MKNIDIEPRVLQDIINSLKTNNEEIIITINNIYESLTKLDNTVWDSPEKKHIDEELMPYLKESEDSIKIEINNCTNFIQNALDKYIESDETLKKQANKLLDVEVL